MIKKLRGTVIRGFRKARAVGFPTANIQLSEPLVIDEGTYLGFGSIDGAHRVPALVFYGRPLSIPEAGEPRCEVHLLGENGDLYGMVLTLELISFIRPNQKFQSEEELTRAIEKDYQKAKTYFHV